MSNLEEINFNFENGLVKIIPTKDSSEIKLNDITVGPFKRGQEVELTYWIAEELVKSGLAKFRDEDMLDVTKLSKIHWKETIPASKQIPRIPKNFYFMLRRFLNGMNEESKEDSSKIAHYEKALSLSKDIVNCRVRKIISLSAISAGTTEMTKNMAAEEMALYDKLSVIISDWKDGLLKMEDKT